MVRGPDGEARPRASLEIGWAAAGAAVGGDDPAQVRQRRLRARAMEQRCEDDKVKRAERAMPCDQRNGISCG